jgi:Mg2+/Co2+ transporter CorB
VHRSNIFMVNIDEDPEKMINQVVESPYTRIPVWKDNNENIIGLIHAKNLLKKLNELKSVKISREDIKKSLIKTWFVPETTPLKNQLQMHLNRKIKLAMVVDEYGVLNGMISLEDIIEEIVGEISDEHDIDLTDIVRNKDGSIKVQAATPHTPPEAPCRRGFFCVSRLFLRAADQRAAASAPSRGWFLSRMPSLKCVGSTKRWPDAPRLHSD